MARRRRVRPGDRRAVRRRRGGGATRNGAPITASGEADLALALVATGFSYHARARRAQAARLAEIASASSATSAVLGSAAVDLCYVAAGSLDAYFEENLNRGTSPPAS